MSWRDQLFSSSAIDENEERLSDGEIDPEQVDLVDESVDVAEKILQVTQYLRGVEDYDAVTYRELRTSVVAVCCTLKNRMKIWPGHSPAFVFLASSWH